MRCQVWFAGKGGPFRRRGVLRGAAPQAGRGLSAGNPISEAPNPLVSIQIRGDQTLCRVAQEAAGFDCVETKKADIATVAGYDTVLLGGGIYASGIAGLGFLKKNAEALRDKKIAVFCVGASPYGDAGAKTLCALRRRVKRRRAGPARRANEIRRADMKRDAKRFRHKKIQKEWGISMCGYSPSFFCADYNAVPLVGANRRVMSTPSNCSSLVLAARPPE